MTQNYCKFSLRMAARHLLWACGALALSACMTVGQEFASSRVMEIEIGKTTKQDLLAMFGKPWRIGREDGAQTWTYGHYHYPLFGEASTRDLLIRFDNHGVVRSYTFSSTDR